MEDKFTSEAELDPFSINAKSSVKLRHMQKGIFWEIKVVTGEEKLIEGLTQAAIKSHQKLLTKFQGGK